MNRCTDLVFATVLSALTAGPVAAQHPADDDEALPPRSERLAELLEALVPLAGHAYAGDWRRGAFPALVRVAGGAVAIAHHDVWCGTLKCGTDVWDDRLFLAGAAVYLGGTVWGSVSARRTARDRNEALREGRGPETGFAIRPNVHRQLEFAVNVRLR